MKYILIIFSMLSLTGCNKECKISGGDYLFEIPSALSPALDTFNIGDTITVTSVFDDLVYNQNSEQTFHLEDFNFFPEIFIFKLDTLGEISNIHNNFKIIISPEYNLSLFHFSDGSSSIYGEYLHQNSVYSLKYLLIPIKQGSFYLQFGAISNSEQDFEGKCSNLSTDISINMNNREDNNFYFIDDAVDPAYQLYRKNILEKFNKFGGYAFYVK